MFDLKCHLNWWGSLNFFCQIIFELWLRHFLVFKPTPKNFAESLHLSKNGAKMLRSLILFNKYKFYVHNKTRHIQTSKCEHYNSEFRKIVKMNIKHCIFIDHVRKKQINVVLFLQFKKARGSNMILLLNCWWI